jgi:uncharacterized membrane protein YedE/YeeE
MDDLGDKSSETTPFLADDKSDVEKGAVSSEHVVLEDATDLSCEMGECQSMPTGFWTAPLWGQWLCSALVGFLFGLAIYKSSVYKATVLRGQFNFDNFIMLKVFISATATSCVVSAILHRLGDKLEASAAKACKVQSTTHEMIGIPATLLGGFLLGIGMTLGGACPGTIWAQLGSGSYFSLITLASAVVTGFFYSTIHIYVKPIFFMGNTKKNMLMDIIPLKRFTMGLVLAGMMYAFVAFLELMWPDNIWSDFGFAAERWQPIICGFIIGLLQIPLILVFQQNLGSSSAFVTLASWVMFPVKNFDYLNAKRGLKNIWQIVYCLLAACGAAAAWQMSSPAVPEYEGDDITVLQSILGGMVIILGSRIAYGCTSGHGISAAGHLCSRSYVAIVGMFSGAIATAFIFFN